ncbi:CoB--CoM heterodisulfide reductase subunit C [Candidatus Hydrogenisulfobacillus filiaventi]|uniref:CoB--CoM heterodisulfide reductase subunit C n=1 Tax=Candidatus Hydrogenisulfobacillus filiaventi TaxID=2707344 RepID=A0A6F8ZET0_9FIRM|nr:CoB--CoM heterodisulfide reductase subunit C [Candidatus Hydrogenisulfobacillus filiaventi]
MEETEGHTMIQDLDEIGNFDAESLLQAIKSDIRYHEVIHGCLNCGICSGSCPSHRFFDYSPRIVIQTVLNGDAEKVKEMMDEYIWACAQCYTCALRCPFHNSPGGLVMIMREVAVWRGMPAVSRLLKPYGRVLLKVLSIGNQLTPDMIQPDFFPDWGPKIPWSSTDLAIKRKAIPVYTLQVTTSAWKVSPETSYELYTIYEETGIFKLVEDVDPNLFEVVNDMVQELREQVEEERARS